MKKIVEVFFTFGSVSHKPSCQIVGIDTGEGLAFATGDTWDAAEKAAIWDAVKHLSLGSSPASKIIEIEIPDPEPVEK